MKSAIRILWVEDDYDTIDAFALPANAAGMVITPARSLAAAKQLLGKTPCEFDLLLIDLILPFAEAEDEASGSAEDALYGLDLISWVRAQGNVAAPIIVFSVVYDPIVASELDALGVLENCRLHKGSQSNRVLVPLIKSLLGG
jgi:CheY-like chemotaxis protein